ncbi:serine hydrolase domain-containing protein [Roseomonas fluvialis]|uniref:Penicillin-binding protein n=1 Tax=Roseomonas fluvialis TaxID=1750527 RepID=A0ABN6P3D0_9PROT|nr:serine hydrolase domain-containing protein [Roseomonas fluvialis]BDG73150.1 penicillin-binding protein [Roseomonas fluvialis]
MDTIQADIAPLAPTKPESVGMSSARLARIRPALQREVDEGRFPGGVVAIARDGRLVHMEAVGFLDAEARVPMRADALFAIASMTKPVCGVAALSLVEEGRLLLSDPVGAYVPPLMTMQVAKPTPAMLSGEGPLELEPQRRPMTVQDAARHTTGFVYGGFGATAVHAAHPGTSLTVARDHDAASLAAALAATPLRHHPGEAWEYGFSTDVLGLVAGAAGGASLGTLMRERIFAPLGMNETGYVLPEGGLARFAKALPTCPLTGKPQSVAAPEGPPRLEVGGAGLVSTAADYLRFAEMLRAGGALGGARVLSPQTVRWMGSDHLQGIEGGPDRMDPGLAGYGFGLTVAVRKHPGGSAFMGAPGAFGWSGVFGTFFWVDPAERLAVVLMAHAPGEMRLRYRRLINMLAYQAIEG